MSWIEIRARFQPMPPDLSPFVDLFRDFGIENTLEEADSLMGCLVDVAGSAERLDELDQALRAAGVSDITIQAVAEDNWEEAWKKFFHPRRVGRKFVIRPTWEEFASQPGDHVIVLDPGQAFGTGDHPTTRMCLELMEAFDLKGMRVADVGCGSGILAIGAKLAGAETVDAVDVDPIAVEVTKENARRNGVEFRAIAGEGVTALAGLATGQDFKLEEVAQDETLLGSTVPARPSPGIETLAYDLVVSNIISATLIRISRDVAASIRPGGGWIVSGIITQNWPEVQSAAEEAGFEFLDKREEDGWVAARFRRNGGG